MLTTKAELVVVGAGPAGLAGAIEAAKLGVETVLVDENTKPGGQLFKQIHKFFGSQEHGAGTRGIDLGTNLLKEAAEAGVKIRLETAAVGLFEGPTLALNAQGQLTALEAQKILIATGASENTLQFPGWTLPGVMGAGAAQTMIHLHRVLPGQRVVMVGSGNVGLIVSYQLLQAGADVLAVLEAAPSIGGYAVHASKIRRMGVPILTRHSVVRVEGDEHVERVVIARLDQGWQPIPGTESVLEADTLCLAVGLSPLAEMAWLAGCRFEYVKELGGHVPWHDMEMQSSVPGVYLAGDITGIEEASTALDEGRLAGLNIAAALGKVGGEALAQRRQELEDRLAAIRQGPFGERLQLAKDRLMGIPAQRPNSSGEKAAEPLAVRRTGHLSSQELEALPGVPKPSDFKGRKLAILECAELIPCNPCEECCPAGAIHVGDPITNLPVFDAELCQGCSICVAACPGLAVFLIDPEFSDTEATVQIPYELLPLPAQGDRVMALNREGQPVVEGRIVSVRSLKSFDRTALVTLAVPKDQASDVRWFVALKEANS